MYISQVGSADVSDAAGADQWLFQAPFAGRIKVNSSYIQWTEATGAMTVDGVVSLKVAGTEVGTATPLDSNTVGDTTLFVVDGTVATTAQPYVDFVAGDDILVEMGTQATGTTTGDGTVFLDIEYAGQMGV